MKGLRKMRMWMISPRKLCDKHLLGEHFEIHKAAGNLKNSGTWAKSLTKKGFLEPQNFLIRHNKLVKEIFKRGFVHKSKLKIKNKSIYGKVDKNKSRNDLIKRCKNCRRKIINNKKIRIYSNL